MLRIPSFIFPYPRVDMTCRTNMANQIEMLFTKSNSVTGLGHLAVWEEGATNYLWVVNLNSFPTNHYVYGQLPERTSRHFTRQGAPPPPQRPLPPSRDSRFFVRVDVHYKTLIPPSMGSDPMYFVFETLNDGQIRRITNLTPGTLKEPTEAWPQQAQPTVPVKAAPSASYTVR